MSVDRRLVIGLGFVVVVIFLASYLTNRGEVVELDVKHSDTVSLPEPKIGGEVSVEQALKDRRSRRDYKSQPLTLQQLSQMLWSAQGVSEGRYRTVPSAGATYPLEVYAVVGDVDGVEPGVYRYVPEDHTIVRAIAGDLRSKLCGHALNQQMICDAPVTLVFTAVYERITRRYGDRGVMYAHMEAGHAGQNVYLMAEAMGLGTCAVGAFSPGDVAILLQLHEGEEVIYLYPVGKI